MFPIRRLLRDERGVSAIEYALLAAMIALGVVSGIEKLGGSVAGGYSEAGSELAEAAREGGKGKGKGKDKPPKDKPPKDK